MAVFPFEKLTEGDQWDVFCRSFSLDLITELSRFKQFQIIAHNTIVGFKKESNVDFMGLKTDYYVHGSFRVLRGTMKVNVQLVDSISDRLVWADKFEGKTVDLLDIQEDLLNQLVSALQHHLNYDLVFEIRKKQRVNLKAYEYWLYGWQELKKGSLESDVKARSYFLKAIDIDPTYSLSYSGMSLTYFNEWSCQLWDRWEVSQNGAYEWAFKALELDEQNYVAAYVLGRVFLYEGKYETAEHYLRKSLRLNPNDPESLIQITSCFVYLGYTLEAL